MATKSTKTSAPALSSVSLPWLIAEVDGMATRVASRVVRRRTGRRMKDGSTVKTRGVTSPGRGSSDQHQFLVELIISPHPSDHLFDQDMTDGNMGSGDFTRPAMQRAVGRRFRSVDCEPQQLSTEADSASSIASSESPARGDFARPAMQRSVVQRFRSADCKPQQTEADSASSIASSESPAAYDRPAKTSSTGEDETDESEEDAHQLVMSLLSQMSLRMTIGGDWDECTSFRTIKTTLAATDDSSFLYTTGATVPGNVTRVVVHPSVEHIPPKAFQDCANLAEVELHEGIRTIGRFAFRHCTSLIRIKIPTAVTGIDFATFQGCTSLKEVELNDGLQSIGGRAFSRCTSLIRMKIPSSVTNICDSAFLRCTSLKKVCLSKNLQTIGVSAFQRCSSLLRINIPSSVISIGGYAFHGCASLREVDLEEGLQSIGLCAFQRCTSLLRIKIPSSATTIGLNAFSRYTLTRNEMMPPTSPLRFVY